MEDELASVTIQGILEKYAIVPSAEQNWLPKKQRIYSLYRFFSQDRTAGFEIKLKFCPDYDPTLRFEGKELLLPEGFLLSQRKNIIIQLDIWNNHNKNRSDRTKWTHFIPISEVDKLLRLIPAVSSDQMFQFFLEEKGYHDLSQVSESLMRSVVEYKFGKDSYQHTTELPELFVSAWRSEFISKERIFFSHGTIQKVHHDRYSNWISSCYFTYYPSQADEASIHLPWEIQCTATPQKNTYGKGEFGEYELTPKWDLRHICMVDIRISSATFSKALIKLQGGLENWFAGTLIQQSTQK